MLVANPKFRKGLVKAREALVKKIAQAKDDFWSESPRDFYDVHVRDLNLKLQVELAKYNLPVELKMTAFKELNRRIRELLQDKKFPQNVRVWPNQIETMAEVIAKLITNPEKSIVVIGATQLGKTMTIILCWVAEALLFAHTGQKYKVFFVLPGRTSLKTQTITDAEIFQSLYQFEFKSKHEENFRTHAKYREKVNSELGFKENGDIPAYIRTNGIKGSKAIKEAMKKAHEKGYRVLLFMDECHWGVGHKSIMNDILRLSKDLTSQEHGDLLIAISATPFHLSGLENINKVYSRTYEGYIGYAFADGRELDKRYPLILPVVKAFSDPNVQNVAGKNFHLVDRRCYYNNKTFNSNRKRFSELKINSHAEYRVFCENALVAFVNNLLVHKNPLNGRGMLLRFFKKVTEVKNFILNKKHLFHKSIKLVTWNGKEASKELDTLLIENGVTKDDSVLVMLNGQGRMGNRVSDESGICYGYDAAHDSSTIAIIQGVIGRLTGKKSIIPLIFLSQGAVNCVDKYVKTLGADIGDNPSPTVTRENEVIANSITLFANTPYADKYFNPSTGMKMTDMGLDDLEAYTQQLIDGYWSGQNSLRNRGKNGLSEQHKTEFWHRWNSALSKNVAKHLDLSPADFVLFDKHSTKENPAIDPPYVDQEGYSYDGQLGFRTADKKSVSNSNLKSDRMALGNKKTTRRLQPQIHMEKVVRGRQIRWKLVAIKFRLASLLMLKANGTYLPNEKCLFYHSHQKGQQSFLEAYGPEGTVSSGKGK